MFFLHESFAFPADFAQALEQALWQGAPTPAALAKKSAGMKALWPRLAKERGIVAEGEKHYSFRREEAEAYAAYYLPANALKPALILEEAFLLQQNVIEDSARWLDVGTGPGTAYWGAAWWCHRRGKKLEFTGWDQSAVFAEIAGNLARGAPFGMRAKFLSPSGKEQAWEAVLRREQPTHLSFMNSIAEIYPDLGARKKAVAQLLTTLRGFGKADGKKRYLLIVEPGSRENSRELAELKDFLQEQKLGRVLFPCLDARPCGALRDPRDWCHEEASCQFPDWVNEIGASVGLRKEALLFSYALISTEEPQAPSEIGRVVSQRMERKGQVECRVCLPEGKRPARVQRSKATPQNEFVLELGRGDLWRHLALGEKGDVEQAEVCAPTEPSVFAR